jgi:hypothetical protein
MDILNQMAKQIFESSAGRIHWRSNMWAIVGSKWDKARLRNKNLAGRRGKSINEHGEMISSKAGGITVVLVKKRATANCPDPPTDDFYKGDRGYWVPATECRKCQYHRMANSQFRYPRCVYASPYTDSAGVAIDANKKFSSMVTQAVGEAKKLLR